MHIKNHKELQAHLDRLLQLSFEKDTWDITVEKHENSLSARQRALYWKWATEAGDHLGYFKDEMDAEFKRLHMIPITYPGLDGEVKERRPSIKKLKVGEMKDYMDRVYLWAGTQGIYLTNPDELHAR